MRALPKGISNHPGVLDADLEDGGFGLMVDVILKDDWHFAGLDDNAPYWDDHSRRTGFFNTLKEFKEALPTQYTPEQMAEKRSS